MISIAARQVARVIPAAIEHGPVQMRTVFPHDGIGYLDPFLLLHHHGPTRVGPRAGFGFPAHPHRGFETVTYVLDGQIQHRDSLGNSGVLNPGDVQWMTAGSGLVHSEMPGPDLAEHGGTLHLFQFWINLPNADRYTTPRYQDLPAAEIPVAATPDGRVKVKIIAGEALGQKARTETFVPITLLHFTLAPGASFAQPVPAGATAAAYVISGEASFGHEGELALFDSEGPSVEMHNPGAQPLDLLLFAGKPLQEPVYWRGPFVAGSPEELRQAFHDYQAGRMGRIE